MMTAFHPCDRTSNLKRKVVDFELKAILVAAPDEG